MQKIEYPYYKLDYKWNKKDYKRLVKDFKPTIIKKIPKQFYNKNIEKFGDHYFFIKENYIDHYEINSLTDFFTEPIRVKCKFGNYPTPLEYWNNNKNKIIKETIEKYNNLSIYHLREMIYTNIKLCNKFSITICLTILNYFKPKKWLDISAGWGDRLISAILYNIDIYVSSDPNLELHPYYQEIIDTLVPIKKRKKFIIYKNGFLESPLPNNQMFDFVFSSPPFFTLEKYSTYNQNSITQHSTPKNWIDHFFKPALLKAYYHLDKNGYFILYMGGFEDIMHSLLDNLMQYMGVIYFYEKAPRAMYVWKKL